MSDESIVKLMLKEHARIETSLNRLRNGLIGDFTALRDYYKDFKWEIERHFFFEERVIFSDLKLNDKELSNMVNRVLHDHEVVLKYLHEIEHSIEKEEILPDLSKLLILLKEHRNFEDLTVYPKLDSDLSDNEKKLIVRRLNM